MPALRYGMSFVRNSQWEWMIRLIMFEFLENLSIIVSDKFCCNVKKYQMTISFYCKSKGTVKRKWWIEHWNFADELCILKLAIAVEVDIITYLLHYATSHSSA